MMEEQKLSHGSGSLTWRSRSKTGYRTHEEPPSYITYVHDTRPG